jgi:hypothetical protein
MRSIALSRRGATRCPNMPVRKVGRWHAHHLEHHATDMAPLQCPTDLRHGAIPLTDRLIRAVNARLELARGEPPQDLFNRAHVNGRASSRAKTPLQPAAAQTPGRLVVTDEHSASPATQRRPQQVAHARHLRAGLSRRIWNHTKLGASICRSAGSSTRNYAAFRAQTAAGALRNMVVALPAPPPTSMLSRVSTNTGRAVGGGGADEDRSPTVRLSHS